MWFAVFVFFQCFSVAVYGWPFWRCSAHTSRSFCSEVCIEIWDRPDSRSSKLWAQSNIATKMSDALAGKCLFFCRKVLIFLRVVNRANDANGTLSKLNFPCVNFAGLSSRTHLYAPETSRTGVCQNRLTRLLMLYLRNQGGRQERNWLRFKYL